MRDPAVAKKAAVVWQKQRSNYSRQLQELGLQEALPLGATYQELDNALDDFLRVPCQKQGCAQGVAMTRCVAMIHIYHHHGGPVPSRYVSCEHPGCEELKAMKKSDLARHMFSQHGGSVPSRFVFCEHLGCEERKAMDKSALAQHMFSQHGGPAPHPCPVVGCVWGGLRKDRLKKHLLKHANSTEWAWASCDTCQKWRLVASGEFEGETPFNCRSCGVVCTSCLLYCKDGACKCDTGRQCCS